jgi:hypothetical protein
MHIKVAAGQHLEAESFVLRSFSVCARNLPAAAEEWDVSGLLIDGQPFSLAETTQRDASPPPGIVMNARAKAYLIPAHAQMVTPRAFRAKSMHALERHGHVIQQGNQCTSNLAVFNHSINQSVNQSLLHLQFWRGCWQQRRSAVLSTARSCQKFERQSQWV